MKRYVVLASSFLGVLLTITAGLLLYEYYFFKQQTQALIELQDQYRIHIEHAKELVDLYMSWKAGRENVPASLETQVSVGFNETGADEAGGDEQESTEEDLNSFLVVNRDLDYLKESALEYIKQYQLELYQMEPLINRIDTDVWKNYTTKLLDASVAKPKKPKIKPAKKNNHKIITPKQVKSKDSKVTNNQAILAKKEPRRSVQQDFYFSWPIERSRFWPSSFFGDRRRKGIHTGIDMAALPGTPVRAAGPGKVLVASYDSGYGNTVVLAHNGKYKTRYAHLKSILVSVGQKVSRGTLVGTVGATGNVKGRCPFHLHFELHMFGKPVNPMHFLA